MKNIINCILLLLVILGHHSCTKDSGIDPKVVDDFLPGRWEISRIELKRSGYIMNDTVILNAGEIFIPQFSSMRMLLNAENPEKVSFQVKVGNDEFDVPLDYMALHSTIFLALRADISVDVHNKLPRYWTSAHLMRGNYNSEIIGADRWLIKDTNDSEVRIHCRKIK
jgi:hypothetical protein